MIGYRTQDKAIIMNCLKIAGIMGGAGMREIKTSLELDVNGRVVEEVVHEGVGDGSIVREERDFDEGGKHIIYRLAGGKR